MTHSSQRLLEDEIESLRHQQPDNQLHSALERRDAEVRELTDEKCALNEKVIVLQNKIISLEEENMQLMKVGIKVSY